jgi:methionyl-tRNA formyltransferase
MSKKINIAVFVTSALLSVQILKKLIRLKKKLNLFLVVSDINFKKKLEKNNFNNFKWINNNESNKLKILKILKNFKGKKLYAFSIQYPWKIIKDILEKFKIFINFHFGDIPRYRGHHTISHAILNNEKFIYGTIHSIDTELDKGRIIDKVKVKNKNISSKDVEKIISIKLANYFEKLIIKLVDKKELILKETIHNKGKFYSINSIEELKEVKDYKEILNKTFAFDYPPHEPAYIKVKNTRIYLSIKKN